MEEVLQILDVEDKHHLGACQILGQCVGWSSQMHTDGAELGCAPCTTCARPLTAVGQDAHASVGCSSHTRQGCCQLALAVDNVERYEYVVGHRLVRTPRWAAARDRLHGQPDRQAARGAVVMAAWGSMEAAWADINHHLGRTLFIPSFVLFLSYDAGMREIDAGWCWAWACGRTWGVCCAA